MRPYLATNMDILTKQAIELERAFDAGKQNCIFGLCRLNKGSYDQTDRTIIFYVKKYIKDMYKPCCQYFSAI